MKVALVCPDGHSILLFCKGIIKALKEHRETDVFVLSADGIYKKEIEALGVKSISVEIYRFFNPLKDFKYLLSLYRVFKREQFDIVINFSTKPNIYGPLAAKFAGVKKIISHVVGLGSASIPTPDLRRKTVRYIFLRLYRLSCKLSDRIWFTNKNDLMYFISSKMVILEKTVLTKNYLDIDYYSSAGLRDEMLAGLRSEFGLTEKSRVVVMVARMIWSKGVKEFVEAAELLKDTFPNLKFLLVAPLETGSFDSVPESYIREKERLPNFKWLGFRNDVKLIYSLSDLAVLPSYYKEGGYPRALLEPMAMGKPVITTDSEDCRGAVEHGGNGYLVPIKDSKALAEAIALLMSQDKMRGEFGQYSRKKVEAEFDERIVIKEAFEELEIFV